MTIEQIQSATPYDIDFITHAIENYMIDEQKMKMKRMIMKNNMIFNMFL